MTDKEIIELYKEFVCSHMRELAKFDDYSLHNECRDMIEIIEGCYGFNDDYESLLDARCYEEFTEDEVYELDCDWEDYKEGSHCSACTEYKLRRLEELLKTRVYKYKWEA